jgi:uncharacterized protein YjbI with pentapeptide repeats
MKMLPPHPPRIDGKLKESSVCDDDEIEVTSSLVRGADITSASKLSFEAARVEASTLLGLVIDRMEMTDSVCVKLEAAALQAYKANLLRVELIDCRMTGTEFAEGQFEDCLFRNVKFDDSGFRFASFKRVRFENCILRQADFTGAKLTHVVFRECELEAANFVSAQAAHVDITGEDLTLAKGLLGLKGATISSEQLMQLAPLFAAELGFHVEDTL